MPPRSHAQRQSLNDEVHARPPERPDCPARITYLALMADAPARAAAWSALADLAAALGGTAPEPEAAHYSATIGPLRVKSERHAEFIRFKFILPGLGEANRADPFRAPAIATLPPGWLESLPGETLVATHATILRAGSWPPEPGGVAGLFARDQIMGATLAGGAGAAFTDFRIGSDGYSRLLLLDHGLTPGQRGRTLQRLLEIDTYRLLALLALPIARRLMPLTATAEDDLADLTAALVDASEPDEPALLERLTRLAAIAERRQAETLFRFSAAASYFDLVRQRITDLREDRIEGLQTFREFIDRRLSPAMNTCRSLAARQEALSLRVAHATQLLATRVDLSSERQSQALLDSMNRRADMQIRLQETVEGLSVAAVTYYIVGLVGHAAEGLQAAGAPVRPALAMGVAIPVVAVLVALALRRLRHRITSGHPDGTG